MYRACQLTRFAPPAYVGIEREYVPGGGDFPCLKFHGLSFPAARATASALHGGRWRRLLDEPAEYRWRMVHGSPGAGSPGVRGNTSNQRMLAPEAARLPRGSPFTLTKGLRPSRFLAERLPRPGSEAFVGVPEGHGGGHRCWQTARRRRQVSPVRPVAGPGKAKRPGDAQEYHRHSKHRCSERDRPGGVLSMW